MAGDPRLTPARPDLAAAFLRGEIDAPRYAEPRPHRVAADQAGLFRRPDGTGLDTQLLHGEPFEVYDIADGWAWGQAPLDGYVGYVRADALAAATVPAPTHRVATLGAQVYARPELKIPPLSTLPFGARIPVAEMVAGYARIGPDAWMPAPCLCPLDRPEPDWVAVAERFRGVPYVWGGRSSVGLDCSALVQLARQAAGHACPRDSDMQAAGLGRTLPDDAPARRGDLIFWKGHVGLMIDGKTLLHANAHHMAVTAEPLSGAIARIARNEFGRPTRRARLDGDAGTG